MKRGDVYLADLDPVKGSEQAGRRPVLVFQDDPRRCYHSRVNGSDHARNSGAYYRRSAVFAAGEDSDYFTLAARESIVLYH